MDSQSSTLIMFELLDGKKEVTDLSPDELKLIPIEYFIKYIQPFELEEIWYKLPTSYKSNHSLILNLPCAVHHNKGRTQVDGPPPPQRKCHQCNISSTVPY